MPLVAAVTSKSAYSSNRRRAKRGGGAGALAGRRREKPPAEKDREEVEWCIEMSHRRREGLSGGGLPGTPMNTSTSISASGRSTPQGMELSFKRRKSFSEWHMAS